MKRILVAVVSALCLVPACADLSEPESAPLPVNTIQIGPLPVQPVATTTTPPAPVAVATEGAVRITPPITEASTTTVEVGPPPVAPHGLNFGVTEFPFPVKHRDFVHWDCSEFDDLLIEYGMLPLDRGRAVMERESGCNPGVWNWHVTYPYKDESFGLFQINMIGRLGPARQVLCGLSDPIIDEQGRRVYMDLFWPAINIRCASLLNPRNRWEPWGF